VDHISIKLSKDGFISRLRLQTMNMTDSIYDQLQEQFLRKPHDDPEYVIAACQTNGLEALGLGRGRVAVAYNDQVLKIPWREPGVLDNMIEMKLWQQASSTLREVLAPSLELRKNCSLVQERCLPVVEAALEADTRRLILLLAQHGITDGAANLGFWKGKIVCYDYALLKPQMFAQLFPEAPGS